MVTYGCHADRPTSWKNEQGVHRGFTYRLREGRIRVETSVFPRDILHHLLFWSYLACHSQFDPLFLTTYSCQQLTRTSFDIRAPQSHPLSPPFSKTQLPPIFLGLALATVFFLTMIAFSRRSATSIETSLIFLYIIYGAWMSGKEELME
jgi:hypothetical protein